MPATFHRSGSFPCPHIACRVRSHHSCHSTPVPPESRDREELRRDSRDTTSADENPASQLGAMSISMRLAFPAPAAAPALPPRLRVRAAGTGASLPVARVAALRREADALRGCASLPLKPQPLGAGQPCRRRGAAAVCHSSAHLSAWTMQWISAGASAVLLLAKGTAIHKSFLVPFFALQAPSSIILWIKSDYGQWTAFLALLVRLFFFIPGELELPLSTMLLVSVAPYQMMNLRGTQGGAILSLAIAGYLAFQHVTRVGGFGKAFEQGSIIATLAIICITVIPLIMLF